MRSRQGWAPNSKVVQENCQVHWWHPFAGSWQSYVLLWEWLLPQHPEDVQGQDVPYACPDHRRLGREPLAQDLVGVTHRSQDNPQRDRPTCLRRCPQDEPSNEEVVRCETRWWGKKAARQKMGQAQCKSLAQVSRLLIAKNAFQEQCFDPGLQRALRKDLWQGEVYSSLSITTVINLSNGNSHLYNPNIPNLNEKFEPAKKLINTRKYLLLRVWCANLSNSTGWHNDFPIYCSLIIEFWL